MKNFKHFLLLGFVVTSLFGCFGDKGKIQYLPCKSDKNNDWGFVDSKGNVGLDDYSKYTPSAVIDGVFSVRESNAYALYQYDVKKPKMILEDLKYVGSPRNGLLPICKKESRIEVVDLKGQTVFVLSEIDGKAIVSCKPYFKDGLLKVCAVTKEGDEVLGVVNEKGKTIINPSYRKIYQLSKNLFYVQKEGDDKIESYFINAKGEKQKLWKDDYKFLTFNDDYVALEKEDRVYIYNMKGEEILKCPEKVKSVHKIFGKMFSFVGEDWNLGVMDFKGDVIMKANYDELYFVNNGFLAKKDGKDKYEFYNKKGEDPVKVDFDHVFVVEDFGIIGMDGNDYYMLNNKFEAANKQELEDVDDGKNYSSVIYSDYFDYAAVCNAVMSTIKTDLSTKGIKLGTSVVNIPSITSNSAEQYHYHSRFREKVGSGNNFSIDATYKFSDYIVKAKYIDKEVRWYGSYTTTERTITGYEFNSNAVLEEIDLSIDVPYDKEETMYKRIKETLGDAFKKVEDDVYQNGNTYYSLDDLTIEITSNDIIDVIDDVDYVVVE